MKNLIYTVCNSNYEEIYKLFSESIKKYNNIDFLLITDIDSVGKLKSDQYLILENNNIFFDRYRIGEWEKVKDYDNFLYLDSDILCVKKINEIFNKIQENSNFISGVCEYFDISLNDSSEDFKFGEHILPNICKPYNAGSFGFNKKLLSEIKKCHEFGIANKNKVKHDQPIFNYVFHLKGLLKPVLNDYVYFNSGFTKNALERNNSSIIHFIGNFLNKDEKLYRMKNYNMELEKYDLANRTELLKSLPKNMIMAEVGVFKGYFSKQILEICEPKELHLIDIWTGKYYSVDENGIREDIPNMIVEYRKLVRMYRDDKRVFIHRGKTEKLNDFPDNYFDFIYIDAAHNYINVINDLRISNLKSKKYISGHDYGSTIDVQKSVNDFTKEYNYKFSLTNDINASFLIDKDIKQ